MLSRLLRLLLVVTLVLNGIAAPSAMARMSHAEHGSQAVEIDAPSASVPHDHAAMAHHGHGTTDSPAPAAADDESCCEGSACQCGCVLPPAVSPAIRVVLAGTATRQDHLAPWLHLVVFRDIPPLRPPAA